MSKYALNLKGHKYGRLEVVRRVTNAKSGHARWLCQCECGNMKIATSNCLRKGEAKSCGCLAKDRGLKHGLYYDPLYKLWNGARQRTTNQDYESYHNYGGRGIKMHPKWENNPESFIKYLRMALGPKPTPQHSLDRINNDEGYVPGNLRWATSSEQNQNRRPRYHWRRNG